jgi:glycosyltransferase involved in cell wall biosynthesis
MATIYIGSLKFSPIFKSHCCAFGKACEEGGYTVRYLFSHEYEWMLPQEIKEKTVFIGHSVDILSMLKDSLSRKNRKAISEIFRNGHPAAVYMQNFHFLNNYVAKLSRKNKCRFIYHVHEPFVANKKAHGGFHQYWLHLFEYFQERLLNNTDVAIVSSREASSLFDLRYSQFSGQKMLIPLIYEDLGESENALENRRFVTFVGPPVPAKNPEKFLAIVKHPESKKLNLKFLLISRSEVKDSKYLDEDNLKAFSQKRISDQDFGKLIKQSIVVITPYKRETQSSVILTSYMYGTPVISSNVGGLPEFVSEGKTGYLLSQNDNVTEWLERILRVSENFQEFSDNTRTYFVDNFSGQTWGKYLQKLLDSLPA